MHLDHDDLALLALGEDVLTVVARNHLTQCPACRQEYIDLFEVVEVARTTDQVRKLPAPPGRVWNAIAGEMARSMPTHRTESGGTARSAADPSPSARSHRLRAVAVAAAAIVIAAAATLGIAHSRTQVVAATALTALPAAPATAHGEARLVRVGEAVQLRITMSGMPAPAGYYEAWLYDPDTGTMYPMGPLTGTGGTVTVTGIDLDRYTGVDISAQPVDDSGGHGTSVLRGTLH